MTVPSANTAIEPRPGVEGWPQSDPASKDDCTEMHACRGLYIVPTCAVPHPTEYSPVERIESDCLTIRVPLIIPPHRIHLLTDTPGSCQNRNALMRLAWRPGRPCVVERGVTSCLPHQGFSGAYRHTHGKARLYSPEVGLPARLCKRKCRLIQENARPASPAGTSPCTPSRAV